MLSFPTPGWTLAVDIPVGRPGAPGPARPARRRGARSRRAGVPRQGRAAPDPSTSAIMYPRLPEWREVRAKLDPERRDHVRPGPPPGPRRPDPGGSHERRARIASSRCSCSAAARRSRSRPSASSSRAGAARWCSPAVTPRRSTRAAQGARSAPARPRSTVVAFDALDYPSHDAFVRDVFAAHGDLDLVLLAFGVLGDQDLAEVDAAEAGRIVDSNFTGAVSVLVPTRRTRCGPRATARSWCSRRSRASGPGSRTSSTGRARRASTRSARVSATASPGSGVRVVVVRPGFVHTKMTEGLEPAPLVDRSRHRGRRDRRRARPRARRRSGCRVALRYVMSVLRHVPRPVFRRLPL